MLLASGKQMDNTVVSPIGTLLEMSDIVVAPNGKLVNNSGFAVAGVVREDEYVVSMWMRQDPQVAAVKQRAARSMADSRAEVHCRPPSPRCSLMPCWCNTN